MSEVLTPYDYELTREQLLFTVKDERTERRRLTAECEALRAERDRLAVDPRLADLADSLRELEQEFLTAESASKQRIADLEAERDRLQARVRELEATMLIETLAELQAVCNSCGSREKPEYSVENDNFYCRSCRCGMGTEYYEAHREDVNLKGSE